MKRPGLKMKTVKRQKRVVERTVKFVTVTCTVPVLEDIYVKFGEIIRTERLRQGMTQEEVASRVGLTRTSVVNIEAARQRVLLDDAVRFAKALSVAPLKIFSALI